MALFSWLGHLKRHRPEQAFVLPAITGADSKEVLFPATPGSWWEYQVGQASIRQTCRGKTVIDQQEFIRFEGDDGEDLYYSVTPQRLVFATLPAILNRDQKSMVTYLEANRRLGETWLTEGQQRIMLLAGRENQNAAGLSLDCWRVEAYSLKGELIEEVWFAQGVGLVRKVMHSSGLELALKNFCLAPETKAASLRVEANDPEATVGLGFIPTRMKTPFELNELAPGPLMVSALAPPPELPLQKMAFLEPGQKTNVFFKRDWRRAEIDPERPGALERAAITALLVEPESTFWVGSIGHGLFMFDGRLWTKFDRRNSLADDYISVLAKDQLGRVWIGTRGRGLARLERKANEWRWILFHRENSALADDFITAVEPEEKRLWVGTELGGLSCFEGDQAQRIPLPEECTDNHVSCLARNSKGLWVGTNHGLYCLTGQDWQLLPASRGQKIRALQTAGEDSLWWGTFKEGAYHFDGNSIKHLSNDSGHLLNNCVWVIALGEAGVWLGTGRGASLVKGDEAITYGSESVLAIALTKEQVWLGTSRGLEVLVPWP